MTNSKTQASTHAAVPRTRVAVTISALLGAAALSGCSTLKEDVIALKTQASNKYAEESEKIAQPVPVVTRMRGAWLLGDTVPVVAPPPAFLSRKITFNPPRPVTLSDVAAYITQKLGVSIDTSEVWSVTAGATAAGAIPGVMTPPTVPALTGPSALSINGAPGAAAVANPALGAAGMSTGMGPAQQYFSVDYGGKLSGLLDIVSSKAGVWWKVVEGRGILFYRTETKTFYFPALANKSKGAGQITESSIGNSGGSAVATSNGSPNGSTSGSSTGGSGATTEYDVDVWRDIKDSAQVVAAGAKTAVNPTAGSVTVTGTPTQVRYVEDWAKSLAANQSQQVSLTMDIYTVDVNAEDNYNWNPSVIFKSVSGKFGATLSGPQSPAIVSGTNPLSLTTSILSTATGGLAQFSGSEVAYNALSTLGHVAQVFHQDITILNGSPGLMQLADVAGYLASQTPSASVAIGATPLPPTLTPGSLTTGLTATFLPKILNGKVFLAMDMTNSNDKGFGKAGTDASFIQTPNYNKSSFHQSTMLTPGQSLLLTGIQQQKGKSNSSGVGSSSNYFLGGGVGNTTNKQITAIVITAKVL
ncbi:hypothetical protein [Cupriavidus nantongensis]|uniref:Type IVB pilus formation outer membrane protein, R64 PilN family n=1 Tax=Cupriavidus nantongensis TaxID=1796606 RepID=A0A142JIW8_9BURK|nr:hypothetical protein [Cupriavidus nantongensis]AMR78030.1 hypothetical protein A2G96_09895 [Cupriavidus nantongensis]